MRPLLNPQGSNFCARGALASRVALSHAIVAARQGKRVMAGQNMTLEELYRLLRAGHVQTQGIFDTLHEALVVLDKSFVVLSANPAFYRAFDTDLDSTVGRSLFELGDGQWDIPELRGLLLDVVPKDNGRPWVPGRSRLPGYWRAVHARDSTSAFDSRQ